jgi:hypothetical protein
MTVVDLNREMPLRLLGTPQGMQATPGALGTEEPDEEIVRPGLGEALKAHFSYDNLIVSLAASEAFGVSREPDPTFGSAWDRIEGKPLEAYWERFVNVRNGAHFEAVRQDIEREIEERRIMDAEPAWMSVPLTLLANIADPTILIPGGAFVRGIKGGLSVARSALNVGLAAGAAVSIQEAGLQATQQLRTAGESAVAIGGAVLLGGLLGAGGSRLVNRAEWRTMSRAIDSELAAPPGPRAAENDAFPMPVGAAAGAQRVPGPDIDALTIRGTAAGLTVKATAWIVPGLRLAESPSPAVRDTAFNLFEMTQYLKGADAGQAAPLAVETLRKEWNAGLMRAVEGTRESFSTYRKRAGTAGLSRSEFSAAVGKAMRRGDENETPEVAAAARAWREQVFEPLKNAAVDLGILPADIAPETAISYFSRIYNRPLLEAEEHLFKNTVVEWIQPRLRAERETAGRLNRLRDRAAAAEDKIARLEARPGGESPELAAARTARDEARAEIEKEVMAWGGRSARRAKAALKARDRRVERAGKPSAVRSKTVDRIVDRTIRRIAESRRDLSDLEIDSNARDIANEVFDKLTGRSADFLGPQTPSIGTRGPWRGRTFLIPDEMIERWLHSDIDLVGRRYQHVIGTDVELARKFGSVDMAEQIKAVREDFRRLRSETTAAGKLARLGNAERAALRDLEGVRDLLRGTYNLGQEGTNFARMTRMANMLNYIRVMGQVTLSSFPEAVRTMMVHGMRPFMRTVGQAVSHPSAFKMSVREAKLAGNIGDRVLSGRLATLADITNFYSPRGPVETFMASMVEVASSWNGIRIWTDSMRSIAAVATQHRIVDTARRFAASGARDRQYLAYLGIDEAMAGKIARQFDEWGETVEGVRVANTERWTDEATVRAYRGAMNKDIDTQVVTRSVADIPLFANTPTGRMLFQFNTFNIASHQRILLRGLQEGPARFLAGAVSLTTLGMMVVALRSIATNRDVPSFAENPGWWIAEGLDYGGLIMVPMQLANSFEKLVGVNPIKGPITAFDESQAGSDRLRNRNLSSVMGPSAALIEDMGRVAGIPITLARGEEIQKGQKAARERLIPFNSYLGVRQMFRYMIDPPVD